MADQMEFRIDWLPDDALRAAQMFYSDYPIHIENFTFSHDAVAIVLPCAPYDHDDWRRAAARDLARAHSPKRVNIVAGADEVEIAATLSYLAGAPGVTGQYLKTHG